MAVGNPRSPPCRQFYHSLLTGIRPLDGSDWLSSSRRLFTRLPKGLHKRAGTPRDLRELPPLQHLPRSYLVAYADHYCSRPDELSGVRQ